jgi:asparagine synthase (glutamine-hydrolysing)
LGPSYSRSFIFGSELKSLSVHPSFRSDIDRNALSLFLRYGYIESPHTIYNDVYKLPPGHLLTISRAKPQPILQSYWSFISTAHNGVRQLQHNSEEELVDQLEELLQSSICHQMEADVPLGAFLSGGIDSSVVVALMQAQSSRAVKTFTIGFNENGYDEALHASAVSDYLGTEHTQLIVTARDALDVIPELPQLYCEPFADPSAIPTYLVAKLARSHVTIALTGDAGDELFSGYNRYYYGNYIWSILSRFPRVFRSIASSGVQQIPPHMLNIFLSPILSMLSRYSAPHNIGDKIHKAAFLSASHHFDEFYANLLSCGYQHGLVIGENEPSASILNSNFIASQLSDIQKMMLIDSIKYLPDDILVKVDRASMGVSLETRVPLLDHRLIEFAWRLPQSMKVRGRVRKWILRQVLYRHIPKSLVDRPKMGFAIPLDSWLRGPLRDWAEVLLNEERIKREGYLNPELVTLRWREHISGHRNWQYQLWNILMFQAWLEHQNSY